MDIEITGLPARSRELADAIDRNLRFTFSRFGVLVSSIHAQMTRSGCRLVVELKAPPAVTAIGTAGEPMVAVDQAIARALKDVARRGARTPLALEP